MHCFKCGCPQPSNEKAAKLGSIATLNRVEQMRAALAASLTRTVKAESEIDEARMSSFEDGWKAALSLMQEELVEMSQTYKAEDVPKA